MFELLIYRIAMHIPKTKAEKIPPTSWDIPKRMEETIIAKDIEKYLFNLLNIIPLNRSSSAIGARMIVLIKDSATPIFLVETITEYKNDRSGT